MYRCKAGFSSHVGFPRTDGVSHVLSSPPLRSRYRRWCLPKPNCSIIINYYSVCSEPLLLPDLWPEHFVITNTAVMRAPGLGIASRLSGRELGPPYCSGPVWVCPTGRPITWHGSLTPSHDQACPVIFTIILSVFVLKYFCALCSRSACSIVMNTMGKIFFSLWFYF